MTASLPDQDADQQIIGYRLTLTIAGPYHRDEVVIEDDLAAIQPRYIIHGHSAGDQQTFERYGDDEEFVEYRQDHVVARRLEAVYEEPPTPPMPDPEALERAVMDMPAEARLRRTG